MEIQIRKATKYWEVQIYGEYISPGDVYVLLTDEEAKALAAQFQEAAEKLEGKG